MHGPRCRSSSAVQRYVRFRIFQNSYDVRRLEEALDGLMKKVTVLVTGQPLPPRFSVKAWKPALTASNISISDRYYQIFVVGKADFPNSHRLTPNQAVSKKYYNGGQRDGKPRDDLPERVVALPLILEKTPEFSLLLDDLLEEGTQQGGGACRGP